MSILSTYPFLKKELDRIHECLNQQLWEAVVFYNARVVEGILKTTLNAKGIEEPNSVDEALERLAAYELAPAHILSCLNSIRMLGNLVRHELYCPTEEESRICCALLETWLSHLNNTNEPINLNLSGNDEVEKLFIPIRKNDRPPNAFLNKIKKKEKWALVPEIVSWVAESLIDRGKLKDALDILQEAMKFIPFKNQNGQFNRRRVRLMQLRAVIYRRQGKPEQAIGSIEKEYKSILKRSYKTYDAELFGIIGGLYKGLYEKNKNLGDLKKSHDAYLKGSKRLSENTYLTINAASTAFLLEKNEVAHQLAERVLSISKKRREAMGKEAKLSQWELLSECEAKFLLSQDPSEGLNEFYTQNAGKMGALGVFTSQIRHLAKSKLSTPQQKSFADGLRY